MIRRLGSTRSNFIEFYRGAYADDHATWPNRALHLFGTFSGLTLIIASFTVIPLHWALAFPVVHAVPGLIGHRLFERNAALGDVRVFSGAYPSWWFMVANHLRAVELLLVLVRGRRRKNR
jgi:hypothetical protein